MAEPTLFVPEVYTGSKAYGPDGKLISREEHARLQTVLKLLIDDVKAWEDSFTKDEAETQISWEISLR